MWLFVILSALNLFGVKSDATCSVEPSSSSTRIYKNLYLTVSSTLASSETVSIQLSSESDEMIFLEQSTVEVNSSSNALSNVFFTSTGTYIVKAICGNGSEYTSSTSISVGDLSLASSTKFPDNISSLFNFSLTFDDDLQNNTDYNCSLSLLNSDFEDLSERLDGTKEVEASGSSCLFTSLRVINKGTYILSVFINIHYKDQTGNTNQTHNSSAFEVTSKITSISLDISNSVDAYNDLAPVLTVKGNDDVDYLDGYSVSLTMSDDSTVFATGPLSNISTTSTTLNLYFRTSGSTTLIVNVTSTDEESDYLTENFTLNVNPAVFVFSDINSSTSKDSFSIQIEIKTASNSAIASNKLGNFSLEFELEGNENSGNKFLVGSTTYNKEYTAEFASNEISIPNVTVLSSGLFEFKVSSPDLFVANQTSNGFKVTNGIKSLNYTSPTSSTDITIYFNFTVEINIFGDDDNHYIGECNSNFKDDEDNIITSYNIDSGYLNTSVYLTNTTATRLKTTCAGFTGYSEEIIPKPLNFDIQVTNQSDHIITETDATETIYAIIRIVNDNWITEETNYNLGSYPFTLKLSNKSEEFSGLVVKFNSSSTKTTNGVFFGQTEGGIANISLEVLSSGEFELQVLSNEGPEVIANSSNLNVENFFEKYSISINSTTIFLPTNFEITLYGSDENKFLLPMNVIIKDTVNKDQNYSCDNENGSCFIQNFLSEKTGIVVFESSELVTDFSIEIKNIKIHVEASDLSAIKTSRDEFELIISLLDNNGSEVISHSAPDACSSNLYIIASNDYQSSGEVLKADSLINSSTNGTLNFTSISILSLGKFTLAINSSCEYIDDWESEYYLAIYNYPKNMSLYYPNNVTVFNYFEVSTIITGDDDKDYLGACNFTLSESLNSPGVTEKYKGNHTNLSIYVDHIDSFAESIACTSDDVSVNETIDFISFKQKLKILFVGGKPSTSDPFDLNVKIQDKDGIDLNSTNSLMQEDEVTLHITNTTDDTYRSGNSFSGDLTKEVENFVAEFTDLQILSSGVFKIVANSSKYEFIDPNESEELDITNLIVNFTCEFSGPQSTYFNFNLTIEATGDDSNPYLLETNYSISTDDNSLTGNRFVFNSTGKALFKDLHSTSNGTIPIRINSRTSENEKNGTCYLKIFKSKLNIEQFNIPSTSDDFFNVIVNVVDNNNTENVEINNGPYEVAIDLVANNSIIQSSGSKLLGATNLNSTNGSLNFTGLKVLSYGNFKVEATAKQNIELTESIEFLVLNSIKAFIFSVDSSNTTFKNLSINLSLIGIDDEPFIQDTDVSIASNGTDIILSEKTVKLQNSLADFSLYSKRAENVSFEFTAFYADTNKTDDTTIEFIPAVLKLSNYFEPTYPNQSFFLEYSVFENLTSDVVLDNADGVDVNISFTCIPNNDLQNCTDFRYEGDNSLTTSAGKVNFTDLKIMSISEFNVTAEALTVSIDSFTSGEYIVYNIPEFKMALSKNSLNSSTEFDLEVFAYYGSLVPYKNIKFMVNFTDVNDTKLSGQELVLSSGNALADYYTSNSSGYYTIKGLKILSCGYFKFNLYFEDKFQLFLETGFVENFVNNITLNCLSQVYINFPLIIEYNSTGDDNNSYKLDIKMSISDDDNYGLGGTLQNEDSEGFFSISLDKNKTYTLNVKSNTSEVSETCQVNALKNTLLLESSIDSVTYIYNSEHIDFTGQIFGENQTKIEKFNGAYTFTIEYTNSTSTSQIYFTSKAGVISDSAQFLIPGTYSLKIKSHPQVITNYTRKLVVAETLEKFSYNSSNLTQPVNTFIAFPVSLYGYSGSLYKNETNITLTCNEGMIIEENSIITKTGKVVFRLYSIDKGSNDCRISAEDYNVEEIVTFLTLIDSGIADQLCFIEYDPTDCYICIENSREDIEGNCKCADHSTYNTSTVECICDKGYNSSNDYCVLCGYFYEASEVTAYYSKFYDSLIVEFGRKGDNSEIDCLEAFTLPNSLKELVTECKWIAEKSIAIYFNETVPGDIFDLIIDPLLIQRKSKGDCDYNVEELSIPVSRVFSRPTPVTTLFAPSEVSAACGTESVYIYTTTYGSSYVYEWSSDDSTLNELLSIENGTSVSINMTVLINPTYSIALKVTDSIFKTFDSKSSTLKVSASKVISVGFTVGSSFSYKVSEALPLKAEIIDACGESGFNYDYILKEDSYINTDLLELIKTNSPSLLNIRPGSFSVGKVYTITVSVESSNSIKGSGTLVVTTLSSDIIIDLSYSDGTISTLFDLEIVASAIDPDNPSNDEFTYVWSCTYNSGVCQDKNGKKLIDSGSSNSISIDKSRLKDNTDYLFKVSVSNLAKTTKSAQVELYASSSVKGLIRLSPINGVVNSNSILLLLPYIEILKGEKNVEWEISPQIVGVELNEEFLLVPRDAIESGKSYIITVYLGAKGSDQSTRASSTISLTVNAPPICDGLSTEYLNQNKHLLTASNCQDTDSDSYILYQFGYLKNNKYSWLTRLIFDQTSILRLTQADKAAVRVCDSSLSCIIYESDLQKNSRSLSVNLTEYKDDTLDFDMIPSSVAYYSDFIESYDDFEVLFSDHIFYFNSIDIDENAFDLFLTVHSTLLDNTLNNIDLDSIYAFAFVELVLNVTNNYARSISSSNFEELASIIGKLTGLLDVQDITEALDTISLYAMKETVVDMFIENEAGNLKYLRKRLAGSDIFNSSLIAPNLTVEFPDDLNIEDKSVYDVVLVKFMQSDGIFEVTFKRTGSVANGLSLYGAAENQYINSTTGIQVEYFDSFDTDKNYECLYLDTNSTWEDGGCKITSVSSDSIQMTLNHLTVFSIRSTESAGECNTGAAPITVMIILIILLIIAIIWLTRIDKSIVNNQKVHRILLIYPPTSIWYKQPWNRRSVMAIQIITCELVMLTFIGAFHNRWDNTNDKTDNSFDNFYGEQLRSGAAGWMLTQVITIPLYILNACFMFSNKKVYKYTVSACLFLILMSFIGIVAMTASYCKGWTEYWFSNWIIFFFIDIFTLEVIYALVMMIFIKPIEQENNIEIKPADKSKENDNEGDVEDEIILTGRRPDHIIEFSDMSLPEYDIIYESFQ